jgi:hypothetical protein
MPGLSELIFRDPSGESRHIQSRVSTGKPSSCRKPTWDEAARRDGVPVERWFPVGYSNDRNTFEAGSRAQLIAFRSPSKHYIVARAPCPKIRRGGMNTRRESTRAPKAPLHREQNLAVPSVRLSDSTGSGPTPGRRTRPSSATLKRWFRLRPDWPRNSISRNINAGGQDRCVRRANAGVHARATLWKWGAG